MKEVDEITLLVSIVFIVIPIIISYRNHLQMEKDILLSAFRGFIQLLLIGYAITFIFSVETVALLSGCILIMIMVASWNAAKRGKWLPFPTIIAFIGIFLAVATSVSVWLFLDMVSFQAKYILPMTGMIIGNSMIICGLTFERMYDDFQQTKELILAKLALGATPRQASQEMIEKTIKAAMIPTVDTFKTIGLVHLPGMMTGMIIAGISPYEAVKYQIVIFFSLISSASLSAMIVSFLSYKYFYSRSMF